jgi:SAM-dependent methyltransferase
VSARPIVSLWLVSHGLAKAIVCRQLRMLPRVFGDKWLRAYRRLREPKTQSELTLNEPAIRAALEASPIPIEELTLDPQEVQRWVTSADYGTRHSGYYSDNIAEKSLEHFLVSRLLELQPGNIYIDIASQNGVAAEIYERFYGVNAYMQDLTFEPGIHGNRIGGDAGRLPLPAQFADALGLHCSFEHFEGDTDIRFIREAGRVLKPGGRCAIVPLYLCDHYACLTNPLLSVPSRVRFDDAMMLHASRSWQNRHGRFYDVERLVERVWENRGPLEMTVFIVKNYRDVDPSCYLRYAALLRKPGENEA